MPPKRKASAMPPKRAGASKKYSVAPLIDEGEKLTDFNKKQWRLGKSFASGGFGRIYYAKPIDSSMKGNFVIKAEPAENGPLFQEFHVYCRIFKPEMIEKYKTLKGLDFLGVPVYYGAGLHEQRGLTHRFLILPLFGSDLEKIRESQPDGKLANEGDVFRLVLNCLDIYEYLHENFYVHADLKADNLLLADSKSKSQKIWQCSLLDYGLAKKVPEHPIYKEQPKKAHDGTLIFTSLDAHRGCAPTYRGDLEILSYNTLYWLTGTLPWIKLQSSPDRVFEAKTKFRDGLRQELATVFASGRPSYLKDLEQFFIHSYSLNYSDKPNFDRLRILVGDMLEKCATKNGATASASLYSLPAASPRVSIREATKTKITAPVSTRTIKTVESAATIPMKTAEPVSAKPMKTTEPLAAKTKKTASSVSAKTEAHNNFKKAASRRLSMLEAAIVKKYCKPPPTPRRILRSRVVHPEESGTDDDDSDTDTNEAATQTSPAMWANRRKIVP